MSRAIRMTLVVALAYGVLMPPTGGVARGVDANGNGISDIWEIIFHGSELAPEGDDDGDGVSNLLESIAGTDPRDAGSVPRIAGVYQAGTNLIVKVAGLPGKRYELQSRQALPGEGWSDWVAEQALIAEPGSTPELNSSIIQNPKYYRIAISEVDSDGDGVSDWEEYELGLDPNNPESNAEMDETGKLVGDQAYVVQKLGEQNTITITSTDPSANQPDPGQGPINVGLVTVKRGGFALDELIVSLSPGPAGPGAAAEGKDYEPLPRTIRLARGESSHGVSVVPLANTNLLSPVVATVKLLSGPGYQVGAPASADVVIYSSATPSGSGLLGEYYTNSSATYSSSANFNSSNLVMTRVDPKVDFTWGSTNVPILNRGYYCVRWTGQVEPQYSETYYFVVNSDDGAKLWVNDQLIIDRWALKSSSDVVGSIALQGGTRYNIRLEYFNGGGSAGVHLSWYGPSQPKQVVPAVRLYASPSQSAPAAVTSPAAAVAFLGQPFSFAVTGANSASAYTADGLPPGLQFNGASGLIAGTPTLAGDYQVRLTASNSAGLGASVLSLRVLDTGSSVVREVWENVPGTTLNDLPLNSPATRVGFIGTLEGITDAGDNYGERVRGYITAPATANYRFWIAGSDSAELWISNDSEPANKVRRAFVVPNANPGGTPANGTGPRQWDVQPGQRSPWLSLMAGQRYYVEILHKAGAGASDNWGVAWLRDPTGTNATPTGVVPGYVLSRFFSKPASALPGTLYSANMLAEAGSGSSGVGSATLRVSADGADAVLSFKYSGLTSPVTGAHIHSDPYLINPPQIIFDIDEATPKADGSYVWRIEPIGTLGAADILELIREGKAYINVHTVNYPAGEINGHFTLAVGAQSFTAPPAPPAWVDDHADSNAAARFLIQATFGPSAADIATVQSIGYESWIESQFDVPITRHLPTVLAGASPDPTRVYPGTLTFNTWWRHSVTAPDQLRQRLAFALSEIFVVSQEGVLDDNARALSAYYDILLDNSFGNFRELLEAVTLSPAMGIYLDMRGNDKGSMITGIHANENYAREILQLFSVGLYRMWPDGTLVVDSQGNLVPTYDQNVIMGFASVFTGWNYFQPNRANSRLPTNFSPPSNYTNAMVLVPTHHELGTKLLLDNVMLPQAWGDQAQSSSTNFDRYCSQDLELALDSIFHHPNVGPFICRQLIQRLVTSNPSRDYLFRVAQKFDDNGLGVRGDMRAVIRAILLDYEARSAAAAAQVTFGKQREPVLRVTAPARAFPAPAPINSSWQQGGSRTMVVTTSSPHRLNTGDTVMLQFTETTGEPVPPSRAYSVTVTNPQVFTVNAPGIVAGTYGQTNSVITVTMSGHGVATNYPVYLVFNTGGGSNGVYQVAAVPDSSHFKVATADPTTRFGSCLMPKLTGGGYVQRQTNVTFNVGFAHGLKAGDEVFVNFTVAGSPADGQYQVLTVPDATRFTIVVAKSANTSQNGQSIFPLVAPSLVRAGAVTLQWSTWSMNFTDTGSSSSLSQTPLNAQTVFNFFFPDYKFPGSLAAAGLTTPEFQLTSDTSAAQQMNFLAGALLNNGANTNGLSSFIGGNGAIVLDLGPWMTTAYTSSTGIPVLVDALNTLLCAGQLSASAKDVIVKYASNTAYFPYSATPTKTQMRDRVRAVAHLILTSPEYTVQR